ncbi:uncharacterized protein V1518DRAFT_415669 [Limtongia smithiae]|uniref:uncharacterized protein n=1 Tax=Limtongia smithiae TaxID=1125753 RepID=UPI0034CDC635
MTDTGDEFLFFTEDTVYTTHDNHIGIVDKVWHDTVRDYTDKYEEDDTMAGPPEIVDAYFEAGVPPKGWTVVTETYGRRVIPDRALRLVDRSFSCGDLCKKNSLDSQSGVVLEISMTLSLQHTETNQIVHDIPGAEVELYLEPEQGQFVSDGADRVGEVVSVAYRAAVRQRNGAIVWVEDAAALECHVGPDLSTDTPPGGISPALIAGQTGIVFPSQTVVTTSENMRRGQWMYGAYDRQVPPAGTVLRSEVQGVSVRWLPYGEEDYFDVEDHNYNKFKVMSDVMDHANWTVGDRVRLRDVPEGFSKYGINRLGRERYGGFDINAFIVTRTHTRVKVQWQDLSTSMEDGTDLVPYVLVDEHDVWPGEYVGLKDLSKKPQSNDEDEWGFDLNCTKIGVVQTVDAKERTAKVRWFNTPDRLLPDNLSDDIEDTSFYELVPHPLINFGLGDFVYLSHAPFLQVAGPREASEADDQRSGVMTSLARAIITQGNHQLTQLARSLLPLRAPAERAESPPAPTTPDTSAAIEEQDVCDWYGQIVALNLDGTVTVRLGFTTPPKDVVHPASAIIGAPEDDEDEEDEDDEEYDDDDDELFDDDDFVQMHDSNGHSHSHYLPYANNGDAVRRLMVPLAQNNVDAEEDDSSWEDEEEGEDEEKKDEAEEEEEEGDKDAEHTDDMHEREEHNEEAAGSDMEVDVDKEEDEDVNAEEGDAASRKAAPVGRMDKFEVLESEPSADHHFAKESLGRINHRRLMREHKILNASLPAGIHVRTYENRLDLFRVLIIGADGTPYEKAPFLFDMRLTAAFPNEPPECFFHSWNTNGIGRVNPNLYEDGKICLSLLGTWPGEAASEKWSAQASSILQLLVSLQSLVLNNDPYYNEAGYEVVQPTSAASVNAAVYAERTFVLSQGFILFALQHGPLEFADVIEDYYFKQGNLEKVLAWEKQVLDANEQTTTSTTSAEAASEKKEDNKSTRIKKVTKGARVLLLKNYNALASVFEMYKGKKDA